MSYQLNIHVSSFASIYFQILVLFFNTQFCLILYQKVPKSNLQKRSSQRSLASISFPFTLFDPPIANQFLKINVMFYPSILLI